MKFLLAAINAKYIHSNPGVYSLRAFARTKIPGADIEIGEYTINHQMDLILQDIYRRKPDFIGFSCYIWNISYIMEIVRDVKKVLPEAEIWLGGPEVSYDAKKVLTREPDVRGIMRGEGELTFTELVRAYLQREKTSVPDGYTGESFRGQAKEETSGCAENTRMPENAEGENAHSDRLDLSQIPGITYRAANGEIEEHGPQRFTMMIWQDSRTGSSTMRAAAGVRFPAVTVFLPSIRRCASGVSIWYSRNCSFSWTTRFHRSSLWTEPSTVSGITR